MGVPMVRDRGGYDEGEKGTTIRLEVCNAYGMGGGITSCRK